MRPFFPQRAVFLTQVRPTLSYQRLQTFQPLTDKDLYEKIRKTVSNKHELQVLEALLIFNKYASRSTVTGNVGTDTVVGTCSKPTSTNRPRSLYLSGLLRNSCQRSSTLEGRTECSLSSVTSSEDSISGSGTLHEVEFESSCQGIGRITPSTRECCQSLINRLGLNPIPDTDLSIPGSTKTMALLRLKL